MEDDKTLMILVIGLFDADDRPKVLRSRLAQRIGDAARTFLPLGWKVEVLVYRFDTNVDAFYETQVISTAGLDDPEVVSVSGKEVVEGLGVEVTGPANPLP